MTEKEYTSTREKKTMEKQAVAADVKKMAVAPKENKKPEKTIEKTQETQKVEKKKIIEKKESACVRGINVPISDKYSREICKFIKGKTIQKAISDLEEVIRKKKAVPMKGEIPHRKGKIMAGRYPQIASKHFINLLKTLSANSNLNGLETPIITEAIANIGQRPYGRFGTVKRKRTHIMIKTMEKKK
jgi:ribosomal protein L22